MSSYSFYCRCSKQNRYGYSPIELSILLNGKRCFINLPRKEKPSVFKRCVQSQKNNDLKEYLSTQHNAVNRAITDIVSGGHPLTAEAIRDYLKYGGVKLYTVKDMFTDFFNLLEIKCTYENLQKYMIVADEFYSFIGDKHKPLKEITRANIEAFYVHLRNAHKASTAAGKFAKLKCIFRYAQDNNKIDINLFSGIRIRKERPKIEYLTESELNTIINKRFDIERLERVRDLFVFQCASGLSYADMSNLKPSDVQTDNGTAYIKKTRQKTSIEFTAVLLDFGVDVLKKYNYQLPILSNQKLNAYLQEIGTLCKISKHLHCHLGRKTYATMLLNKGVNISVVARTLGHSNTRITESTYAALQTKTVLNEVTQKMRDGF